VKTTDPNAPANAPVEVLVPVPSIPSALGSDPFSEAEEIDPFLERLEALIAERAPVRPVPRPAAPSVIRTATRPAARATPERPEPAAPDEATASTRPGGRAGEPTLARIHRRRWMTTPTLDEVELPTPDGWLDRLLGDDERQRLAALTHLVEGEARYDRYGFSPRIVKRAFPLFYALYRLYFRVRSQGHENLPAEGPVILAANHGGVLPFDGAMVVTDSLLNTDPPRLPRAIVDRWAGSLPWVNIFFARVGQVIGTRENFADLLDDGHVVLVFPEGIDAIRKTITQRYRLQRFRVGFVEQALRAGAPIVPVAIVGSDDQAPILYDLKPLARRLGLPVAPITPTFPWLGPLGLLPYPVSYRIVYGEPLRYHERFGPEGADDARLVRYIANQVRRDVQHLVDRSRR
jgi:1-acyl-sn-glycerol-3-phosphate acyltransferase